MSNELQVVSSEFKTENLYLILTTKLVGELANQIIGKLILY